MTVVRRGQTKRIPRVPELFAKPWDLEKVQPAVEGGTDHEVQRSRESRDNITTLTR